MGDAEYDRPLYDDLGNYIGPALESDEEVEEAAAPEVVRSKRGPHADCPNLRMCTDAGAAG